MFSLTSIFDWGAPLYALTTNQAVWLASGAEMARHFPPATAPRVLDLGTGPAISIVAMRRTRPDARFVGLDFSAGMLAQARRSLGSREQTSLASASPVSLVLGEGASLPFGDACFEVVTGHSFLYLLPDPIAVLRETHRVLRPGGLAIFMEPHADAADLGSLLRHSRHLRHLISMAGWRLFSALHRRYTPERFAAEARAADLTPTSVHPVLHNLGLLCLARRNDDQ